MINGDGSGYRDLTPELQGAFTPQWLPDGRRLVFRLQDGDDGDLAIVDLETGGVVRFADPSASQGGAVVTPDGRTLVYSSVLPTERVVRLDLRAIREAPR